jgi:hypothetical protein
MLDPDPHEVNADPQPCSKENCWSYMKGTLKGDSTQLEEAIKNMWIKNMDGQYFKNVAD